MPTTLSTLLLILATTLLSILAILLVRTLLVLPAFNPRPKASSRRHGKPTRLLVVLGSGGHTAEMLSLLRDLNPTRYTHRTYLVSSGDSMSASKASTFEANLLTRAEDTLRNSGSETKEMYGTYDIVVVPRARKIHQSLLSTPVSALQCLIACFAALRKPKSNPATKVGYPDLILSNGPGTAVMVIFAALLMKILAVPGTKGKMRTIYVESWARVGRLSLSGRLLLRVVDRFVVQWEKLVDVTGGKAEYHGTLVD